MLVEENWPDLLVPGLRKVFDNAYRERPSNIGILFNVQSSQKAVEHDLTTGDMLDFAPMNGVVPYDDMGEGYRTDYTHSELARGFKVERKLVDDDLYNVINKRPRMLGLAARRRRETDAASMFNNAFNSGITGGDGVSLCNSAHPANNGGATQSNVGTLDLTDVNLEATRRLMIGFHSDRDQIIEVIPDFLLVPLALEQVAFEIINSRGKVDTALNNANFHYGKYKLLVWPNYLSSSLNWFLMDSVMMKEYHLWFDRIKPEFQKDREFDTYNAKYSGYMRYSYGWSDWRAIFGNNPAS
jgi:hypothetical protein